jgi:GWxTD domain-containing protein
VLTLRRFPEGELSVSDFEFARSVAQPGEGSTFVKPSGLEVEPNPGRVYGVLNRTCLVYLEVYDLASSAEGARTYELEYRIRDGSGAELRSWSHALRSLNSTWVDTTSFQVSQMQAGTYSLGVVVRELVGGDEGDRGKGGEEQGGGDKIGGGRAAVEAKFDVVWAAPNWVRWLQETEALVPFLPLGSDHLDRFNSMGPGAKERYIETFWAAHDPTPGPANATREEFDRRIEFSNSNFSTPLEPGMRTDRGRVYIRYGEPDEIRREVIPVQGNDINAALDELDRETGGDLRGSRSIDPEDARAFEVWIFDYRGDELFPSSQMSTGLGRQFVFVDDLGIGDFRLIRSSEKSEF